LSGEREPLPAGWRRVPFGLILALRKRGDARVPEYHAEVYKDDGNANDLAEAWCYFGPTHLGATVEIDGMESRYDFHLGLPKATFGLRFGRPRYPSREREYGWRYHNGTLRLLGGASPNESSRDQPWWWEVAIDFEKLLFGKARHERRLLGEGPGVVAMSEALYPCKIEIEAARWWRTRDPLGLFRRESVAADIEFEEPVPVPGKGENAWDVEDDSIGAMHLPLGADADGVVANRRLLYGCYIEAADRACVEISRQRERYGGPGWSPKVRRLRGGE